ncbi:MAG: DUF1592 domain-containing protein [Planctomycetota bacterium]
MRLLISTIVVLIGCGRSTAADDWTKVLDTFVQDSCVGCHDEGTDTRLDFGRLSYDLTNKDVFRQWVHVFDRIELGEMPPASETPLDDSAKETVLALLGERLRAANREKHETIGRVPSRRLSRQEYEHTLHDLLGIGGEIAKHLPPENEAGSFDVVAESQEMSSVHVRSLLRAADLALDEAIQLGKQPQMAKRAINYAESPYIQMWVDRPVRRGGGTVFKIETETDTDIVTFRGENFVFRSDANGFRPPLAGKYRVTITASAYQPRSSITVSLKRQNDQQGDSALIDAWDLVGSEFRTVETMTYLRPDDYIYVSADELEPAPNGAIIYNSQPASSFGGEGVRIRRVMIEGPLNATWPPERTRDLFTGVEWKSAPWLQNVFQARYAYDPVLADSPVEHTRRIVASLAPRAFRREVTDAEIDALVELAKPRLKDQRRFVDAVRIALRGMLVSPQLLFHAGDAGPLNNHALASRLSYFLWRSLPDEELFRVASEGKLIEPEVLANQVDRMLNDPKSQRFVHAFLDQWLELGLIDATTPDGFLYPEYDDVLRHAMLAETRHFFSHLIESNLSVENLIDSDFTFLNRRLAEHYGIDGVEGEHVRKVPLDAESVRGGILAHASIAKVTANGTVTTPVKRGNFVLTNLLGLPPNPPPPNVGSIEPDIRGATTIRETLQKHQEIETCAVCHRKIDPPGFALECFDPIGNFRDRYRNSRGIRSELPSGLRFLHKNYTLGLPVDASGTTDDGKTFTDVREFKRHLLESREQVARNVVSKLVAFSTGGEVEFSDRDEVEKILSATQQDGYRLRSLIHQLVASPIFRNR